MFRLRIWLLRGSSQSDIIYSENWHVLILTYPAHFKRLVVISFPEIFPPDFSLVSSKSLTIQPSPWLATLCESLSIFAPDHFSYSVTSVHCLTYCHWEDFPSLLFFRATPQWGSNTQLYFWIMSVYFAASWWNQACHFFFIHSQCQSPDGEKGSNGAGESTLGTWISWSVPYLCHIFLDLVYATSNLWWNIAVYTQLYGFMT